MPCWVICRPASGLELLGHCCALSYPHRWSLSDFGLSVSWRYFSSMIISCLDLCNSLLTCLPSSLSLAASTLNMVADGVVLWKPRIMSLLCSKCSVLLRGKTKLSYCLQSTAVIWLLPPHLLALSPTPCPYFHSGLPDAPASITPAAPSKKLFTWLSTWLVLSLTKSVVFSIVTFYRSFWPLYLKLLSFS